MNFEDVLELEVPPAPEHIGTVRMFVGAGARHFGVEEEDVANLKVAVSEACTGAMQVPEVGEVHPIRVRLRSGDGTVHVEVSPVVAPAPPLSQDPDPQMAALVFEQVMRATLINALFPDAELTASPGGWQAIRFSVPAPGEDPTQG